MFARTCLTLTLCFTSTLAAAKEPARRAEGPIPAALAKRTAEPPPPTTAPPPRQTQPDLTPATMKRDWQSEYKWLQAGTAVSWILVGLGTIGTIVPLSTLRRCNIADAAGANIDCSLERRTASITTPIVGLLTLAALVPAIMFSTRLSKHRAQRPMAKLQLAPGGMALHF